MSYVIMMIASWFQEVFFYCYKCIVFLFRGIDVFLVFNERNFIPLPRFINIDINTSGNLCEIWIVIALASTPRAYTWTMKKHSIFIIVMYGSFLSFSRCFYLPFRCCCLLQPVNIKSLKQFMKFILSHKVNNTAIIRSITQRS